MTNFTTMADIVPSATISNIADEIDDAIVELGEAGIDLHMGDAVALLARIGDADRAAAALRQLARLIEFHGAIAARQEAEAA